ncbi:hypothetical protein [Vagococcus intermedius]|uniref:Uncharacterized protein n=1 Tax=Vagococcus intermedius TaxID=2991418 RepID=A0AAF0CWY9_9ENTE|nr:hypothetical protein [Vagococcus intermedius]WEG74419.1 hypothetical protein OL234_10675 [Vagococcus intermedius]WEG76539.1 hypothetical protein OL235_10845 [Vagococcus intermedius]
MLEDIYPLAVVCGISSSDYWDMTYKEILEQCEAFKQNQNVRFKERATFDYRLANLLSYAFNDPSKMPKLEEVYPFMKKETSKIEPSQYMTEKDIVADQAYMVNFAKSRENKQKK